MKKIVLILFSALILSSCEKEQQPFIENTDIPLISKVLIDGTLYYEYTYTDANLLSEERSKYHYTKHNYNNQNLLSSSEIYMDAAMFSSTWSEVEASMNRTEWVNPDNTAKSLTQTFEYTMSNQLVREIYTRPSSTISEYAEFTLENGRIIRQTLYWEDKLSFYIDYEYDETGNLIKQSKFYVPSTGIEELWTTTEYEFDNMHNPFRAFKHLLTPGKYTNPNNITKETYTIHFEVDQWTQKVQVTDNTYQYNNSGYPIKVNGEVEYLYRQ